MSLAAHLLLAAAVAATPQEDAPRFMAIAQVSVELVRPAAIRAGQPDAATLERAQRSDRDGRVLYEFQ